MPFMNGADATIAFRQQEDALPNKSIIITWSSSKSSPYPKADNWLPKMVREDEVLAMLRDYQLIG